MISVTKPPIRRSTHEKGESSPLPSTSTETSSTSSEPELPAEKKSPRRSRLFFRGRAGETSPNSICRQRHMSAAIVTDPNVNHEYLEGRPRIHCPMLERSKSNASQTNVKNKVATEKPSLGRSKTAPVDRRLTHFVSRPAPLRLEAWSEANATSFKVRGASYLSDGNKYPSEPSAFRLLAVDVVRVEEPIFTGLCTHPEERVQQALRKEKESGIAELPEFLFAVNLCIPGASTYHWVAYFGLDDVSLIKDQKTPLGRIGSKFFFGDSDSFRDKTFKLIPRIVEGNFVVKSAVGSKPSILGSRLKQYYIRDERFFEIVVDIGSSPVAQRIVKLALGYATSLVVDMMFLLEGIEEAFLPEHILGGVRMKNVDFKKLDGQRLCPQPQLKC